MTHPHVHEEELHDRDHRDRPPQGDAHRGRHRQRRTAMARLQVVADRCQTARLLAWAAPLGEDRTWAIESADGLGKLLAQQLLGCRRARRRRAPDAVGQGSAVGLDEGVEERRERRAGHGHRRAAPLRAAPGARRGPHRGDPAAASTATTTSSRCGPRPRAGSTPPCASSSLVAHPDGCRLIGPPSCSASVRPDGAVGSRTQTSRRRAPRRCPPPRPRHRRRPAPRRRRRRRVGHVAARGARGRPDRRRVHPRSRRRPRPVPDRRTGSRPTTAPPPSKPPAGQATGTGSTLAGTASSTTPCTWPPSPRSAHDTPGRAYYDRKLAEGKSQEGSAAGLEAAHQRRRLAPTPSRPRPPLTHSGPGRTTRDDSSSSVAGSHPEHRHFGQVTPGPDTNATPAPTGAASTRPDNHP